MGRGSWRKGVNEEGGGGFLGEHQVVSHGNDDPIEQMNQRNWISGPRLSCDPAGPRGSSSVLR